MIRSTLNSTECFLLTEEPNWAFPVLGRFNRINTQQVGSTKREERSGRSVSTRTALVWKTDLDLAAATALEISLRGLTRTTGDAASALQPILCPFWPALRIYGASSPYSAKYSVIFEPGWTSYAIFLTSAGIGGYTSTAYSQVAPLLWGVFDKLPKPQKTTDELSSCEFSFRDTGPSDAALSCSVSPPNGPTIHGRAWPIFPKIPQYTIEAGGVDITIDRRQLGYTRDEAETVYPQTPRRVQKSGYELTAAEAADLIGLWQSVGGSLYPFWIPSGSSPTRLTADIVAGDVDINVESCAAFNGHAHMFINGQSWAAGQIVGTGSTVFTLTSAPGAFAAAFTYIQPLTFSRFAGDTLSISWSDPAIASSTIDVVELPPEYGSPSGETLGTTLGGLGFKWFLYRFTDGTTTWYVTSGESAITYNGNAYTPQKISHGTISERINLQDSSTTIEMRNWTGNPLSRFRRARLQTAMAVTILSVTSQTPATDSAETIFTGRVKIPKFDGSFLTAEVGGETAVFNQMFPRPITRKSCNAMLFDSACKLVRSQWTFACTLPTAPAAGAPFEYTVNALSWPPGTLPAIGSGYFSMGFLVRTLADGTQQANSIVDSSAISGGAVVLTLDGDLFPFPTASESWSIAPGCAGRYDEDCKAKFGNGVNFRAFPRMPRANPASTPLTPSTPAGGKKG